MAIDILVTMVGLLVAGLAAVIGIWVERDPRKPPRYAYGLSFLILMATGVGLFQTYLDAKAGEKLESDMARMLATLDKIANEHGADMPELQEFVKTEMVAQSRANPEIVQQVAQRVADDGRDPNETLARTLPASEVQTMQRDGKIAVKPPTLGFRLPGAPKAEGEAAKPTLRIGLRPPGGAASSEGGEPSGKPGVEEGAEGEPGKVRIGGLRLGGAKGGEATEGEAAKEGEAKPAAAPRIGLGAPKPAGDKPAGDAPKAATPPAPAPPPPAGAPKIGIGGKK